MKRTLTAVVIVLVCSLPALARPAPEPPPAAATAATAAEFDVEAATDAYLARQSPEARARSDAYFEGGYWIQLWSFLWGLGVAALLLGTRLSAGMRDLGRRIGRRRPLATALYGVQYVVVTALLTLPWSIWVDYVRERRYGLATQNFGGWLSDQAKGLAVGAVAIAIVLPLLYGAIRRAGRRWWLWGAGITVAFLAFMLAVAPVFIEPLFNTHTRLEEPAVRDPILSMARANGISASEVWVADESRQSKRISAHVSGAFGTERITLNDNLLNRCSLPEIEAVMAHEMGHYVLGHLYTLLLELGLVIVLGFAFVAWAAERILARRGARWGIGGVADVASLPLLVALLSVFMFVMTPVTNTIVRTAEAQADIFGIDASRQPDGFAEAALALGEYRKLAPGPVEEFLMFDHPSGRSRIRMAMRWKKENLGTLPQAP